MSSGSMENVVMEHFTGSDITRGIVMDAAALFSRTYGVWSNGNRVRMSANRLSEECLPKGAHHSHARAMVGKQLVGHVFAACWACEGQQVCWITQLCVDPNFRRQGLATRLLLHVRQDEDAFYGMLSSHPAAILAFLRACGGGLEKSDLTVAAEHAKVVMQSSPVRYVRTATLRGSLFDDNSASGAVCCADTNFWVDHKEPDEVLEAVRERGWPFGQLPDGHEFLGLIRTEV
ncbi:hypothetical protein LTR10_013430 [Elasticomyces elasticus]|uniref:N-acetyltransferase domain-containing protein n=1 Tax=Exophiala sideris TaxID=1016849 RepID=A0ABR0J4F2_9EURO|nr:hypothetical protein LTR10_013430 [Elasticomyces elasticus]KAK5027340.1 hypothetical protein LTS07_006942 [Exophiala sideris]KAK5034958.1 hypothetical protein LTR13_006140 [Exophiala sideris]KAK5056308.1 hypothetical protein LTR69_007849 [Exophiala sideris]KAK5181203.1 hypothetical protein LTR44_006534 [Eurotiomycetes sp. CCFEE 6388]